MKILSIETSCDDTSLAIVEHKDDKFLVHQCIAYSQIQDHQTYGGVVPEIASRLHAEKITALLGQIDEDTIKACDAIAVTTAPGLPGSLLVGKTTANFLGSFYNKPILPVYHIYGHIFSILLERSIQEFPFPRVILTASGGHNDIYLVEKKNDCHCEEGNDEAIQDTTKNKYDIGTLSSKLGALTLTKLGSTLDDAAGECFDKVARMLGGPYPGGAWIGEKAAQGKPRDDIQFKRIFLSKHEYNFSFSGMKSQVHYLLENRKKTRHCEEEGNDDVAIQDKTKKIAACSLQLGTLKEDDICDIAYEFQEAVIEVLAKKTIRAAIQYKAKTIGIVGGVSANTRLREYANEYKNNKYPDAILTKPVKNLYSTDNAAMIAAAAIIEHHVPF